jgi:holo-[acyl-carrier protein] synthase
MPRMSVALLDEPPRGGVEPVSMKFRVGVAIVEVGRLAQLTAQDGLSGVLTAHEVSYCTKPHVPAEHMAARFAAKEAALKALGTALQAVSAGPMSRSSTTGTADPPSRCTVVRQRSPPRWLLRAFALSLSHTAELAIPQVVTTWAPP